MGDLHSVPVGPVRDVGESEEFTAGDHQRMRDAIADAHRSFSATPTIVMPWELPGLSMVFGDEETPVVPNVPAIQGHVEPVQQSSEHAAPAVAIRTKTTAFAHAIASDSRRVEHLEDGDQLQLLAQKWEAVLSVDYHAFDLGLDLVTLPYDERVRAVMDVLGGKSTATIPQRLAQISRDVKWVSSEAKRPPFPVSSELIKNYVHQE